MLALYSSLVTLAVSTVAWPAGVGLAAGILVGGGLAYGLVDRVLRAQGANPQRGLVRRLSTVCCLAWGLTLPLGAMAAGVVWGVGFGVGALVDGHEVGAPVTQSIEGGRASGFRTANSRMWPPSGGWRVDLSNEMGQLIDRVRFDVRSEAAVVSPPAPPAPVPLPPPSAAP